MLLRPSCPVWTPRLELRWKGTSVTCSGGTLSLDPSLEARAEGDLAERLALELRTVGAEAITRGVWRSLLGGADAGHLDAAQVWDGIRATDADLLDRPTVGAFL